MPPKSKTSLPVGPKPSLGARAKNIGKAFVEVVKADRTALPLILVALLVPILLGVLLGLLTKFLVGFIVLGIAFGLLAGFAVFARKVQSSSYKQVEGQPGASLAVVSTMRGVWLVTEAVQVDPRTQSMVHRLVSRGGIVLLVEGEAGGRLVGPEVRMLRKVAGDTPLQVLTIGRDVDETPIDKLQAVLMKIPRVLTDADAASLDKRLKALAGAMNVPMPKGPMPGKARMPKQDRRGR